VHNQYASRAGNDLAGSRRLEIELLKRYYLAPEPRCVCGAALAGAVLGLILLILIDHSLDSRPPRAIHVIIDNGAR
jgi:hypothetical protein